MKLIKKYGLVIFWVLLIIDCFLISFKSGIELRIYTKPLLLISIATYFYVNTKRSRHLRSKAYVYFGLFVNWSADSFFLANDFVRASNKALGDRFLFVGLCLTLCAFLSYTFLFRKMSLINIRDCQEAFLAFLAMVLVSVVYYKTVIYEVERENATFFKPLIVAGLVVLTAMMCYAANVAHNKVRKNIAWQFFIPGTITLILAVGIIFAYRFFLSDADFLPAVIELTYGFGMMLLIRGFTKFLKA